MAVHDCLVFKFSSYVFDGKPPELKSGELTKRKERRNEAEKELEKAKELGDSESVEKFERRLVRVTSQHNDECKDLLKMMGIPYITVGGLSNMKKVPVEIVDRELKNKIKLKDLFK